MEKLNIAELLKDCPKGMELDCTMFENVTFVRVDTQREFPIEIKVGCNTKYLTKEGCYHRLDCIPSAKCVIFPKGKTTWEGFQRPFKDGDVVTYKLRGSLVAFIYKKRTTTMLVKTHFALYAQNMGFCVDDDIALREEEIEFATEKEKQKLFKAIKDNGYKWNPETKTLEKLEVNKFDITTLKRFKSEVLVRSSMDGLWKPAVFGFRNGYNDNAFYIVGGSCWKQCIPYLNNEHLCGTTNDCDDFYKTWE